MYFVSRANQKIKKGMTVRVRKGRDAGKTGKVLELMSKAERVLIEKINIVKKHQRPNQQNRQGGIVEKEAPVHLSNVELVAIEPKAEKKKPARKKKG